ncbi:hypothetical protein [Hydrogenophaga intermedia]|uniref:hypothetical protein n=1 Tax=Hydrogenophaga intermedia TaxID=65786 RepID=UPI002043EABD|nr:hypothetical protein [Hydrogenophaga intermedia]
MASAAGAAVKSRRVFLGKGLTKLQAWRKARAKPGADFRGMSYNARTGWATLT